MWHRYTCHSAFETLQEAGLGRVRQVHNIASTLGQEKCNGMVFFHAFTGCDVVSAFIGKAKKTAWQTWDNSPQVSEVFKNLSQYPPTIDDEDLARLDLFAYDAIPPTRAALEQHVKRAAYQAACVWSQVTVCHMQNDSPANWGYGWHMACAMVCSDAHQWM